ncbi:hypothetical protein BRD04_02955, partial [Halobacteriales archaeon QS_9_67_17]
MSGETSATPCTSVNTAGTNAYVVRPTETATVRKVNSRNERANIAARNVAARNSRTSGTTPSSDSGPPPTPTAMSVVVPSATARYGSVLPATMSPRESGATSSNSPRRLSRSFSIVEPYACTTKFSGRTNRNANTSDSKGNGGVMSDGDPVVVAPPNRSTPGSPPPPPLRLPRPSLSSRVGVSVGVAVLPSPPPPLFPSPSVPVPPSPASVTAEPRSTNRRVTA